MELKERLSGLVGHNVCIKTNVGKGNNNTNEGILEEVGLDYLVIKPVFWDELDEIDIFGGQQFVKVKDINSVQHIQDCRYCINNPAC